MRYEIDGETFAIKIFNDGENIPFQFQPEYPNGDKFESVEEASTWAELSIAAHSPEVMEYAPNGKGLAPEVKADPNIKADLLKRLGITADEAKLLLS